MHLDALFWAAAWMGTMGGASLVAGAGIEPAQGGLWARCLAIWLPRTKIGRVGEESNLRALRYRCPRMTDPGKWRLVSESNREMAVLEPVKGIEPLTVALQKRCSAY